MKRLFLTILSAILCLSVFAQENTDPNRLLIYQKSGNLQGYILDRVDYIEFETIYGEVAADVTINEVTLDKVMLSVQRTAECQSFKLSCFPSIRIASASDENIATMIDSDTDYEYYQDFESAEMSGMKFEPNTDYTIVTVGIDAFGVLCDVRKASFTTPSKPLVGDPQVAITEVDIQKYEFTLSFKPNADVSKFSFVTGKKGELQSQYQMFAPMFGFSNMGQMIEMWGINSTTDTTFTWKDMTPGAEHEIFVQMWDNAGTMTPYFVYELSTLAHGGEGTAEVAVTLDKYIMTDWWGETLPSQFITFTPNDQTNAYRFEVYLAENYDADPEIIKAELCSEPPMPMEGWFQYEELTTDFQINPNTECVVIAAGKNINGEWGPVTELRFTTPAEVSETYFAPSRTVVRRSTPDNTTKAGKIPYIANPGNIKLIAR